MEQNDDLAEIGRTIRSQAIILGGFIFFIWLLEAIDWVLGGTLDQFGIMPRQISGLWGIAAAPLLHVGFAHVAANTIPFLVLGWFVLLRGTRTFITVTLITDPNQWVWHLVNRAISIDPSWSKWSCIWLFRLSAISWLF